MKRLIFLSMLIVIAAISHASIGTWKTYMAYGEIMDISAGNTQVFVLATNDLYSYNTVDMSITEYNKVKNLSDVKITHISWNKSAKRLTVVYDNSNIDLITENEEVTNVADIYTKSTTDDKTINHIYDFSHYAYLSANFGIIKLNVKSAEISETYNLGKQVSKVAVSNGAIFALLSDGSVLSAALTSNLLDKNNWQPTSSYDPSIFNDNKEDWNKWYPVVSQINLHAPKYNNFGYIKIYDNKLYTCGGGCYTSMDLHRPGTIQVMDSGGQWTFFQDDLESITGYRCIDIHALDIDPTNRSRVIVGGRTGMYEFLDGKFVRPYSNDDGSMLQTAAPVDPTNKTYVVVKALKYDKKGNLWCFNSMAPKVNLLEMQRENENVSWKNHFKQALVFDNSMALQNVVSMMFDSRDYLWFCNDHWNVPSLYCYIPSEDKLYSYTLFVNEDGTNVQPTYVKCITEDKDGNMWIGTDKGPLMFESSEFANPNPVFQQIKVPRGDGSGLADYLLSGVSITGIAIDGAGRKWFASETNGVYLISEDNYEQIFHFKSDNSPLLSNNIESIAINDVTGEVFFGTDKGLCSFMGDATAPQEELNEDNVWAYPNPVTPDYTGVITITGLTKDAQIKVVTPTGYVIAEGISNGGTFVWDGNDRKGKRVASGVYSVLAAIADGNEGVVCKIAIIK